MNVFEAVVQGIVQGITEFLPVSSSGHLLISQHILGVKENNLFFNVMLHIGTLIAVLAVYYKTVLSLIGASFTLIAKTCTGKLNLKKINKNEQMVLNIIIGLTPLFLLFLPLPGISSNVKQVAEELSNEKNIIIVGISLIATSILINKGIHVKHRSTFKNIKYSSHHKNAICDGKSKISFLDALWIGVTQLIAAIFPGISRSGSTLSVGLMRGISKQDALDYSFILGIPAIIAAAALELKDAFQENAFSSIETTPLVIGMIVSAVVGFLSIKIFKWLLKTDKMMIFVVYTFIVGAGTLVVGIIEKILGFNVFTGTAI